jgi:hypothetical protein
MRPAVLVLAALLLACSSNHQATSTAEASTEIPAEDGSMAGCTSLGGVCMPYTATTCPILQRDPISCNDAVLVCCLPTGPTIPVVQAEAGPPPEPDSGGPASPMDASSNPPTD